MKRAMLSLVLVGSSGLAQPALLPTPAQRPRLTAEMMAHSASARSADTEIDPTSPSHPTADAPADVTMMAPFAVTASALPMQITHDRPVTALPAEHDFDWRTGGTILRSDGKVFSIKAGVEYDPEWNVLNLLKISW